MNDIVFAPEFRPWELEDAIPRLRVELALYKNNQAARLMDALHKASFRGGQYIRYLKTALYRRVHSKQFFCPTAFFTNEIIAF